MKILNQLIKLIDKFQAAFYEWRSHFVAQRVYYKIEGECKKCGKCCNYMYSIDTYSKKEFQFMQFLFPQYKRFEIKGEDEQGNLIFGCKLVTDEGLCSVYEKRLKMCKAYPEKRIPFNGKMHEGCGYKVVVEKKFDEYLE